MKVIRSKIIGRFAFCITSVKIDLMLLFSDPVGLLVYKQRTL